MKKVLLSLILIILFAAMAFIVINFNLKQKPLYLGKEYKIEMEQIINDEYPNVIENIDRASNYVKDRYDRIVQIGYNDDYAINVGLACEMALQAVDIGLFSKMQKVTQEKYLKEKYTPVPAGDSYHAQVFMYPYLKDNNVDLKLIDKYVKYIKEKEPVMLKSLAEIEKIRDKEATQNQLSKVNFKKHKGVYYNPASFDYDAHYNNYYMDIMVKYEPEFQVSKFGCPRGVGEVSHLIFSNRYSEKEQIFEPRYKGYACSDSMNQKDIYSPVAIFYDGRERIPSVDEIGKKVENTDNKIYLEILQELKKVID